MGSLLRADRGSPQSLPPAGDDGMASGAPWRQWAGAAAFSALAVAYVVRVDMSTLEVARLVAGAAVLWGPLALVIHHLVAPEVADRSVRIALASVGSYALTATLYFLCSVAGWTGGFYVLQVAAAGLVGYRWLRLRRARTRAAAEAGTQAHQASDPAARPRFRVNWLAPCLVALALFTTAPYTKAFDVTPGGSHNMRIPADSLYYVSHAYELARQLPPAQDPTRAGTPARSYHLLPHVNTVLLVRVTGQPDLLRAQMVYHLTLLTVLAAMLLYALGKCLTSRRLGGYALVALLYPLALVGPPLLTGTNLDRYSFEQFYFTPLPQLSSMLDPVVLGSWQTYSAVVVALGLMLVVAAICLRLRDRLSVNGLLALGGLVVACSSRYRAQVFMVAVPAFVLVVGYVWLRSRKPAVLGAGLVPLVLAVPLLLEAASSRYRPGSSGLGIGFNGLTVRGQRVGRVFPAPIFGNWPFSRSARGAVDGLFAGRAADWTWQVLSLTAFVVLNMLGPLLLVGLAAYLARRSSWSVFVPFTLLVLAMAVGSLLVGMLVKSDFDSYSLAGQALYLPPWYLFPCLAVAAVRLHSLLDGRLHLGAAAWVSIGVLLVAAGAWARDAGPASRLARFEYDQHIVTGDELGPGRWATFEWIRKNTPDDAVVVSNDYLDYRLFFSGLGGRATYLEARGDITDMESQRIYGDDRLAVIADLWTATEPERFCRTLTSTPATHLVEFASRPLRVSGAPCLSLDWSSPGRETRVWAVGR